MPRVQARHPLRPGITARNQFRRFRDPLILGPGVYGHLRTPAPHALSALMGLRETSGRPSRLLPGHGLHPPRRYFEHPDRGVPRSSASYIKTHTETTRPAAARSCRRRDVPAIDRGWGGDQSSRAQGPGRMQSGYRGVLPAPCVRRAGKQVTKSREPARASHPGAPVPGLGPSSEPAGAAPRGRARAGPGDAPPAAVEPRRRAGAASSSWRRRRRCSRCCRRPPRLRVSELRRQVVQVL